MAYKALYRTYRPSTFDEVAGQEHIIRTLKNALASDKLSHAYLFCGPRGTGKTTMAKLLAKAVNCDEGQGHQCNKCQNCEAINNGSHPDVLEIDAASNRGINEIKDLIDKVKYSTILGKKKIFIIDEVHMMTPEAFNALLKTLEEPPEHVIFILATTEPHKLLPTILSRCQRYDFSRVGDEQIRERIHVILQLENIKYEEEALNLIIDLADGGMRDALSMLDQVIAFSGNEVKVDDILNIFSLESKQEKLSLIHSIIKNDVSDVIKRLNKYIARGSDIKRLTNDLLAIFKDALIYRHTHSSDLLQFISAKEADEINALISVETTNKLIAVLLDALKDFKTVVDIHTLFEIALLKLTSVINEQKSDNTVKVVSEVKKSEPAKPAIVAPTPTPTPTPVVEEEKKVEVDFIAPTIKALPSLLQLKGCSDSSAYKINDERIIEIMVSSKKDIKNTLNADWKKLRTLSADAKYGDAANILLDGRVLVASNKIMILELPTAKLQEKANSIAMQKLFQTIIHSIFDKQLFVYSVNRSESIDLQKRYMDLASVKKLPKIEDINLEMEEKEL